MDNITVWLLFGGAGLFAVYGVALLIGLRGAAKREHRWLPWMLLANAVLVSGLGGIEMAASDGPWRFLLWTGIAGMLASFVYRRRTRRGAGGR